MENPGSLWVQSVAAPPSLRTHHFDLHPSIRRVLNWGPKAESRALALSEKALFTNSQGSIGQGSGASVLADRQTSPPCHTGVTNCA
jgi:hypothetical protein